MDFHLQRIIQLTELFFFSYNNDGSKKKKKEKKQTLTTVRQLKKTLPTQGEHNSSLQLSDLFPVVLFNEGYMRLFFLGVVVEIVDTGSKQ